MLKRQTNIIVINFLNTDIIRKNLLYDILAIEHCRTKLIEECIYLKLFISLIFIQKPYQMPQISGTFITLVLAPCIYVRKIAYLRERNTKHDPRKSPKSMYVFSSHTLCYYHDYEKDQI